MSKTDKPPELLSNEDLAYAYERVEFIEQWCKAVVKTVEDRLARGETVPGYKLVEGKRGARKWDDSDLVLETAISHNIYDEITETKLKTPPQAEKVLKNSEAWPMLQDHVVQDKGKPKIAPLNDPRDALDALGDDFDDLTNQKGD